MFEGTGFPKSLDDKTFNQWLENGRLSKIGYHYLIVMWDEYEAAYQPVYLESRKELDQYEQYKTQVGRERLVAVYDLYSESRIL